MIVKLIDSVTERWFQGVHSRFLGCPEDSRGAVLGGLEHSLMMKLIAWVVKSIPGGAPEHQKAASEGSLAFLRLRRGLPEASWEEEESAAGPLMAYLVVTSPIPAKTIPRRAVLESSPELLGTHSGLA